MKILRHYGFYILIIVVISELLLPFVLGHFSPGFSQTTMLISNFGRAGMPTRWPFKIWEIINGSLFILATPAFYNRFIRTSRPLALGTAISVVLFGIGDCIMTGLVDEANNSQQVTLTGLIHNYASGLGFAALLLGTLLLILLYHLEHRPKLMLCIFIIFLIASLFMFLFGMPKLPVIGAFQMSQRGLWQRLNLLFLYLPFVIVGLDSQQTKRDLQR